MPHALAPNAQIGLIVGVDLIGDALIKLPVLRALRAAMPKARVHWITSKGATAYSGPLRNVTRDLIDEIHEKPTWLKSKDNPTPTGQAPAFDLLIDTRNRWHEALLAKSSVPHGLFISPALRFLLSGRRPPLFAPKQKHMVDRMLQQLALGLGQPLPKATGRLPIDAEALAKAKQILPPGPVYIGFAPGAGNPIKIWPLDHVIAVAKIQAEKNRVPVFLLGPQEEAWQAELTAAVPNALFPLQRKDIWGAKLLVDHTLAVASLLHLAVSNDSGTGHMLAAVDCPLISLFGPTSPTKLAPRVTRGYVVSAPNIGTSGDGMIGITQENVLNMIERAI